MAKKKYPLILTVLVFAACALFGATRALAECDNPAPCEAVRIYTDEDGLEKLKTEWDPCDCSLAAVYTCPDDPGWDDGTCITWEERSLADAYCGFRDDFGNIINSTPCDFGPRASGCVFRNYCYAIGRRYVCR
jgi:hypothetical protein